MSINSRMSRRSLLKATQLAGVGAAGAWLVGCGDDDDDDNGTQAPSGQSATAAPSQATGEEPKAGGELVIGSLFAAASYDPMQSNNGELQQTASMIVEPLVRWKTEFGTPYGQEFEGVLATEWTSNADNTEWTFKLRPNVKFHDGTDFNAEVVQRNVARGTADKSSPYFDALRSSFGQRVYGGVDRVEAPDPLTVKFTLKAPDSDFIGTLCVANSIAGMMSAKALDEVGDANIGAKPIGTGPFKFESWMRDDQVKLVRNDEYWRKKPLLDVIIIKLIPDESTRLQALVRGDVDWNWALSIEQQSKVREDKNLFLQKESPGGVALLQLNTRDVFTDVRVRQALSLAIDREGFNKGVIDEAAIVSRGLFLPGTPFYKEGKMPELEFNIDKAKALLSEAGASNLKFKMLASNGNDPAGIGTPTMAQHLQANWAKAGIDVELNLLPSAQTNAEAAKGLTTEVPVLLTTLKMVRINDITKVFDSKSMPPAGQNRSWWTNTRMDELIEEAKGANIEQAKTLMLEMEEIAMSELPVIPILGGVPSTAYRVDRVKGIPAPQISDVAALRWEDVWLA